MKTSVPLHRAAGALLLASLLAPWTYGQVNFDGATYTESFDALPTTAARDFFSATAGVQSLLTGVPGWSGAKIGGTNTSDAQDFRVDTGSGNSGSIYSYGAAGTTERSLGLLASNSNVFAVGAEFLNTSGGTITSITITLRAEFWRSSTSVQNVLPFAYGFSGGTADSANFLSDPSLAALTDLNVVGPAPVSPNAALDGNNAANQANLTATLNGLNWAPNTSLYIRWADISDTGSDAGLAIDDFTLSGTVNTGADVSRGVGTTFSASSFGGNAFTANDNAVFNGTAATVNLSGAVTANSLKFEVTDYALTGTASDPLTLTSGGVSVATDVSANISAVIAGTSGLTKTGAGSLDLSGVNTFTGNFVISAGTLSIPSGSSGIDTALGNAANDVTVNGTLATTSTLYLGSGRTVGGSGTLQTNPGSSVILDGPVNATSLTIKDATALNLNGATNQVGTLAFAQPTYVSVSGGELVVTSGLVFNQTSGASTYIGTVNFGSALRNLQIDGGSVTFDSTQAPVGQFKADNRIIKSGAGTLDLTKTTWTSVNTNSGFRCGVQGAAPLEGGQIDIDEATDLGVGQLQFNSGVLNATTPLTFTQGVSIGGRVGSVSRPTFTGAALTFSGSSGFFAASGASGDLGLGVNNITTLAGTIGATVRPTATVPEPVDNPIDINGTGTLVISGNASALLDRIFLTSGVTLAIEGTLGSLRIQAASGTTVTGGGTYSGYYIPAGTGIAELYKESNAVFQSDSTLAPAGTLAFQSNLNLQSGSATILSINGATIDTGYDSIDVSIPAGGTGIISAYTLTYGGNLTLDFGATAANGDYTLFATGTNVTRTGSFTNVFVTGSYSDTLTQSGTTWSKVIDGKTFSFEETTGVLTVSGGVTPVEAWRSANFPGSTATEGVGADTADFDGDGLSNLLEYATDLDPVLTNTAAKVAGASPVVVGTVTTVDGTRLTLTYPKNPAATDVTYTVQATNDLGVTFTTGTGTTIVNGNTVTYTDDVPLNSTNARRFLRLQVAH